MTTTHADSAAAVAAEKMDVWQQENPASFHFQHYPEGDAVGSGDAFEKRKKWSKYLHFDSAAAVATG